jgi:hypothetical protein
VVSRVAARERLCLVRVGMSGGRDVKEYCEPWGDVHVMEWNEGAWGMWQSVEDAMMQARQTLEFGS